MTKYMKSSVLIENKTNFTKRCNIMEKNQETITRIVICDLIKDLKGAILDKKDPEEVEEILSRLDEEYKYLREL